MREINADPAVAADTLRIAEELINRHILTRWQADKLLQGRHKGFFLGKYRLLSLLGTGGMSTVYLAEHRLMRRRVALKVLPKASLAGSSHLERFHKEAQAVAALDHRNIVRAYDVDQEGDIHFLVMEYVAGRSLHEIVAVEGKLDPVPAAEYVRQAAEGLNQAHKASMVHRDIKPGNLLLDDRGTIKVLDLGLARFFDEKEESSVTKRHDEKVLGTADYLSPEQALDSHSVDIRSDIYSLGCTFYFMLLGRPPFNEGTLANRLLAHQTKQPDSIASQRPEIPKSLILIVEKMMQKRPEDRYQTARELANTLADWLRENGGDTWAEMNPVVGGSVASLSSSSGLISAVPPAAPGGESPTQTLPKARPTKPQRDPSKSPSGGAVPAVPPKKGPSKSAAKGNLIASVPLPAPVGASDSTQSEGEADSAFAAFLNQIENQAPPTPITPTPGVPVPIAPVREISESAATAPIGSKPMVEPTLPAVSDPEEDVGETRELPVLTPPQVPVEVPPVESGPAAGSAEQWQGAADSDEFELNPSSAPQFVDADVAGDGGEFSFTDTGAPNSDPTSVGKPGVVTSRATPENRSDTENPADPARTGVPVWRNPMQLAMLASGILCLVLAVWWVNRGPGHANKATDPGSAGSEDVGGKKKGGKGKKGRENATSQGPVRRELKVGPGEKFTTLAAALADAKKNGSTSRNARQTITLPSGQTFAERIVMDESWPRGIQIVCPGPQPAVLAPAGGDPIVTISATSGSVDGFKLEGVRLDATGKDVAVQLTGFLEGAQFVNLVVTGFRKAGFALKGVQSFGNTPVLCDRVLLRNPEGDEAVGFELAPSGENACARVRIRGCRFFGPLAAGVTAANSAIDLEIEESIFHQTKVGVLLRGTGATWRNLMLAANTFHQNDQAIQFVEMPGEATSGLGFYNNLFVESKTRDAEVGAGFKEREFLAMIASVPGGIAFNWTTRARPEKVPPPDEIPSLVEARLGRVAAIPKFVSTDPASSDFLAPTPDAPQTKAGIAEALIPLKRFGTQVGAVRPKL